MITIEITKTECQQFQHILPMQGNLRVLEVVDNILNKIRKSFREQKNEIVKIEFDSFEINFIKDMINLLDEQNKVNYNSFSLIQKFLDIKETENV